MGLQDEFQDIVIKDTFEAKPDRKSNGLYYIPILFSAILPKEWVTFMERDYVSHQHKNDDKLLDPSKMEFPTTFLPDEYIQNVDILRSVLFFRYSMVGGGPHPNTQESLGKACKKANLDYRRLLAETEKREEYEEEKRRTNLLEQQKKDQQAIEATRDWFKDKV